MAKTLWSFGHSECNRVKRFLVTIFALTVLLFDHVLQCVNEQGLPCFCISLKGSEKD